MKREYQKPNVRIVRSVLRTRMLYVSDDIQNSRKFRYREDKVDKNYDAL